MKLTITIAIITIATASLYRYHLPPEIVEQPNPIWIEIRGVSNVVIRDLPGISSGYRHFIRIGEYFSIGETATDNCSVGSVWVGNPPKARYVHHDFTIKHQQTQ